jgi:dTDP-4-amino-4,6-dideoxygalactose transaminase
MPEKIPFTDIYSDDDIADRVTEVLESGRYVKGPRLETFETEFADLCGTDHAVGVSSGTAALLLALKAAGIGEGDDVLVPAHTFFASVSPVLEVGARPVFVDVDPDPGSYTLDPDDLAAKASEAGNPQAVVPVHLYGHPADMDRVREVAADHDLTVIEDAAQAHGAEYDGQRVGSLGEAGCFSFYPSKNMTVGGDGGMVVTDDGQLADRVRQFRNHGRDDDGTHRRLGLNYRLDETNAAVGLEQLSHLRSWNRERREAAERYTARLSSLPEVTTPSEREAVSHVYHLYVVEVPDRDALREHLADRAVETGVHYPTPAHRHPPVEERVGEVESVERAEAVCDRIVSLPMHPDLDPGEVSRVCDEIAAFYGESA